MSARRNSTFSRGRSSGAANPVEDVDMTNSADEAETDAEAEPLEDDGEPGMYQTINRLTAFLCSVTEDGEELAAGFQRIPNRRTLPDYFEVIPEPIAFSTIRGKIQKKQYTTFSEFVKDVAQICHNAQVYNRPSAPIFGAAVRLQQIFKDELRSLADKGQVSEQEAALPDLGELPPVEESPSRDSEAAGYDDDDDAEEEEEDDDDEEEDDDDEYETDDNGRLRKRKNRKSSSVGRQDRDREMDDDARKRRGRPPMVMTPAEARIASVLRGLRKFKAKDGSLLISPFEKLPDKNELADYYQIIANPIALDNIKKKAKRKKYRSLDQLLTDLELMFHNAKSYNEDDSELFLAATELQQHARVLADQEKSKSDDEFRDEDGKLPLAEIEEHGQIWKVGDWVHIRNPNDLAKPIVAQVYRMWQDREGERWINACWYYRPEQTVHRYEKHFFEHEVVKTGQYRDHQINEVVDQCFVMFVTRFNKGRPRGFPPGKDVYVCESRYNEEKFRFNKIKTWASCVPDEVRDKDYEMDLFDAPRPMKKVPSPIKHLLREDAKPTDALPRPTWGSPNAPPIVGAVHRRPPEANETPPPETAHPTAPVNNMHDVPDYHGKQNAAMGQGRDSLTESQSRPVSQFSRAAAPQSLGHVHSPHLVNTQPTTPMTGGNSAAHQPHVPMPQQPQYATAGHAQMRPVQFAQSHQGSYNQNFGGTFSQSPSQSLQYQPMNAPLGANYYSGQGGRGNFPSAAHPSNVYNPPKPPEVYTLPESSNEALDATLRLTFQHDDAGRVLFFTAPPLDRSARRTAPGNTALRHSLRYLAGREEWLAKREDKRKQRNMPQPWRVAKNLTSTVSRTLRPDRAILEAAGAIDKWFVKVDSDTTVWMKDVGLASGDGE